MGEPSVFDDIMQGLHEIEEYQNGKLRLKSTVVSIPDPDINAKYDMLPEEDKLAITIIINKMLLANRVAQ